MRVSDGRMRPRAPATSAAPRKRTSAAGTAVTHGICGTSALMGCESFMPPAMRNVAASSTCTSQRVTWSARLRVRAGDSVAVMFVFGQRMVMRSLLSVTAAGAGRRSGRSRLGQW
jgi:hypothetical protein